MRLNLYQALMFLFIGALSSAAQAAPFEKDSKYIAHTISVDGWSVVVGLNTRLSLDNIVGEPTVVCGGKWEFVSAATPEGIHYRGLPSSVLSKLNLYNVKVSYEVGHIASIEPAYVACDHGVFHKSGDDRYSYSVKGSPSWDELFTTKHAHLNASNVKTYSTESAKSHLKYLKKNGLQKWHGTIEVIDAKINIYALKQYVAKLNKKEAKKPVAKKKAHELENMLDELEESSGKSSSASSDSTFDDMMEEAYQVADARRVEREKYEIENERQQQLALRRAEEQRSAEKQRIAEERRLIEEKRIVEKKKSTKESKKITYKRKGVPSYIYFYCEYEDRYTRTYFTRYSNLFFHENGYGDSAGDILRGYKIRKLLENTEPRKNEGVLVFKNKPRVRCASVSRSEKHLGSYLENAARNIQYGNKKEGYDYVVIDGIDQHNKYLKEQNYTEYSMSRLLKINWGKLNKMSGSEIIIHVGRVQR